MIGRLRSWLGRRYRALPAERRTDLRCPGASRLAWRKLLAPGSRHPIVVGDRHVGFYAVGTDPVDERVVHDLLHHKRELYFPSDVPWPPAPLILDLGMHHGLYAVAALAHDQGARLIGVEPNEQALPIIDNNLSINPGMRERTRIVHGALAEAAGTGMLKICARGSWGDSLYEEPDETVDEQAVPLVTLAQIVGDQRPDVIKCNAEGGEFALVDQLAEAFAATDWRPRLMIIMVHEAFGSLEGLTATLGSHGYQVRRRGSAVRPALQVWLPEHDQRPRHASG